MSECAVPEARGFAAPIDWPAPIARWWMVTVLFACALISYTDRLVLSILVDPLRADLGLSDFRVGLLQGTTFTVIYVLASLPLGRAVDRVNRKRLLVAGAVVWSLSTALCGLAVDFSTLFIARLLIGAGEAVLVPAAVSLIADSFPSDRRGAAIGFFAMGTGIGGPLGISVGGVLFSAAQAGAFDVWGWLGDIQPWRQVLVLLGLSGLIGPMLLLTLREPERRGLHGHDPEFPAAAGSLLSQRRILIPLYLGCALMCIGDYGLLSWAPALLSRRFDWNPEQIGVTFGIVTTLASVSGNLAGGWLSDLAARRNGVRSRLAMTAAVLPFAAAAALLISGDHPTSVLIGVGLWSFASPLAGMGALTALQDVVRANFRGLAMAIFTSSNTIVGLGGGPALIALTSDRVFEGPAAIGFATSTVVALAVVVAAAAFLYSRHASVTSTSCNEEQHSVTPD